MLSRFCHLSYEMEAIKDFMNRMNISVVGVVATDNITTPIPFWSIDSNRNPVCRLGGCSCDIYYLGEYISGLLRLRESQKI